MNNIIRLTESQFKSLIRESVHSLLKEMEDDTEPAYLDYLSDYDERYIFQEFVSNPKSNTMWLPLINPSEYKKALDEYTQYGELIRFPKNRVYQWMGLCLKNIALLRATTAIYGHSQSTDIDAFVDEFFDDDWDAFKQWCQEHDESPDWGGEYEYLEENGFIDWSDSGTDTPPYSDYGLEPLEEIASEYNDNTTPEECLVLINRMLDVVHCRGDLSSLFIKGGAKTLYNISNN